MHKQPIKITRFIYVAKANYIIFFYCNNRIVLG